MPSYRQLPVAIAAGACTIFLLAACGGSTGPAPTEQTPTPQQISSPRPPSPPGTTTPPQTPPADIAIDLARQQPLMTIFGAGEGDLRSDMPGLASGDFNADGLDDILIGARFADGPDDERPDSGEAYVVFGSTDLPASLDLATGEQGLTIYGAASGDNLGFAAATDDVNGDGSDDILLGAPFAPHPDDPAGETGAVYILFGGKDLAGVIDLNSHRPDVTLTGAATSGFFGDSLASGDVNGDGLADLIVGATFDRSSPPGGPSVSQTGAAYVFFGRRQWPDALDTRAKEHDVAVFGAERFDELGDNVSSGDINGDGFDDIIVTAEAADGPDNARPVAAEVHVVFGAADISGEFYVGQGDQHLSILGAEQNDTLGFALASGDLNGDGIDDLAMTARLADGPSNSLSSAGEAYILLGARELPSEIDLAQGLDGLLALHAPDGGDLMGPTLIADLTGDGRADLLLGVGFGDGPGNSRSDSGEVYVVDATAIQGFASLASTPLEMVVYGAQPEGRLGTSLATGDVNGDGRPELIAVASDADGPGQAQQDVGIIYMLASGT